jgi:aldose 1-epimerase
MKPHFSLRTLLFLALPVLMAASVSVSGRAQAATEINGEPVVTLTRAVTNPSQPEFTSVTVMPGRGMEVLQITANWPGKGSVDVLSAPSLAEAADTLNNHDNPNGDRGYTFGAAFLIPYPNRIRGTVSADGKSVTALWEGHELNLPANTGGRAPGSERVAMHGLILKDKAENVQVKEVPGGQEVTGIVHAGDFGGHWLSKTDLLFTIKLTAGAVDVSIKASNVGGEAEPMAIGAHPYFNLPSGDRAQARVHVPATLVAEVNNYKEVFPTGKLLPVTGTQFDMLAPEGRVLDGSGYDDNWSDLLWKDGAVTVKVTDPEAHYGVDVIGLSPEIKTIQAFSPTTAKFVAVEEQYNFGDPFGKEWGKKDTGMVTLKPGQSTTWHIRVHLFVP